MVRAVPQEPPPLPHTLTITLSPGVYPRMVTEARHCWLLLPETRQAAALMKARGMQVAVGVGVLVKVGVGAVPSTIMSSQYAISTAVELLCLTTSLISANWAVLGEVALPVTWWKALSVVVIKVLSTVDIGVPPVQELNQATC